MKRVLVVEDCADQQELVARALGDEYRLAQSASLREARRALEREVPDLVLLDVSLPDGSGYRFCCELRDDPRTRALPVIFLTGRGEAVDKAMAFSLGADDYVEKPFHPLELRARMQARLRPRDSGVLRAGALEIHPGAYRAFAVERGVRRELDLTPREFRILHLLASHPDRVFSRGQLLAAVWGDTQVTERTVDTHISNLRSKLGAAGRGLETLRGAGYRLRAPATFVQIS